MNSDLLEEMRDFLGGSEAFEKPNHVKEAENFGRAFEIFATAQDKFDPKAISDEGMADESQLQPFISLPEDADLKKQAARSFNLMFTAQKSIPMPKEVIHWVARLLVLKGIPIQYLLPTEQLLPPESARFFYLDPNWIAALVQGALSIGRDSGLDHKQEQVFWARVVNEARKNSEKLRINKEERLTKKRPKGISGFTGFLLRSELVSGYPGLEFEGFANEDDRKKADQKPNKEIPLLHMERLLPDVMLAIFDGAVKAFNIHGPPEGLHFRINDKDLGQNKHYRKQNHKANGVLNVAELAKKKFMEMNPPADKHNALYFAKAMIAKTDRAVITHAKEPKK